MKWILLVLAALVVFIPSAYAVTVTRESNYNLTDYGNTTHTQLLGLAPRLADGSGHFNQDYYFYNNTSTYTIASGFGTYVYTKSSCGLKFYPPTQNTTGVTPTINAFNIELRHSADSSFHTYTVEQQIGGSFCNVHSFFDNGTLLELNGTKQNANVTLQYMYKLQAGQPMKTWYTIIPKIPGKFWRVTETQSETPDIIHLLNSSFIANATTFQNNVTKFFFVNNLGNPNQQSNVGTMFYIDPQGRTVTYNYQTSLGSLNRAGVSLNYTSGKVTLFNDFQTANQMVVNSTFTVDPIFGYTSGVRNGITSGNIPFHSGTCSSGINTYTPQQSGEIIARGNNIATNTYCQVVYYSWATSSIPKTAGVSNVTLMFGPSNEGAVDVSTCDIFNETAHNSTDYSISNTNTLWGDAINQNNRYYTHLNVCKPVQPAITLKLENPGNNTDLINDLQKAIQAHSNFQLGFRMSSDHFPTRSNDAATWISNIGTAQIQITYQATSNTTLHIFQHNASTVVFPGTVRDANFTKTVTLNTNSTGFAGKFFSPASAFQNYTVKDLTSNFVVNKTYNYQPLTNTTLNINATMFTVNCPSDGTHSDLLLLTNDTDGHKIKTFSTPQCVANNTVSWIVHYKPNGQNSNSYTTKVWGKILNTTAFGINPDFVSVNGTQYPITYNGVNNTFISNSIPVGTGLQDRTLSFTLRLLTPTTPTTPSPLTTVPSGNDKITLFWHTPSSDGGSPITGYKILRNSTTLVSNTGNTLITYQDTGIKAYHLQTYQVCALNVGGCGALSNQASNYTFIPTQAHLYINYTIIGDEIGVEPRVHVNNANPTANVTSITLRNNTHALQTVTPNSFVFNATTHYFGILYAGQLGNVSHSNYTVSILITNATGGNLNLTSNATGLVAHQYLPKYFIATVPTLGTVNYTTSRSNDGKLVFLNVNRDKGGSTWDIQCHYQTAAEIGNNGGEWDNRSNIGYYSAHHNDLTSINNIYISCWDPNQQLFTTTVYANGTLLAGINYFNTTFQGFIGVPVGVLFLAMFAGLATGRTAPTYAVIILAAAAIMAGLGFFTIAQNVWGLCLIAAACALFAGKKFL